MIKFCIQCTLGVHVVVPCISGPAPRTATRRASTLTAPPRRAMTRRFMPDAALDVSAALLPVKELLNAVMIMMDLCVMEAGCRIVRSTIYRLSRDVKIQDGGTMKGCAVPVHIFVMRMRRLAEGTACEHAFGMFMSNGQICQIMHEGAQDSDKLLRANTSPTCRPNGSAWHFTH